MLLPWTSGQPGSPDRCPTLVLSLEGSPLTHAHTPHPVSDPPSEERGAALSPVASQTCGWGKSPSPHPVPKERSPQVFSLRKPKRPQPPSANPEGAPCLHCPGSPAPHSSASTSPEPVSSRPCLSSPGLRSVRGLLLTRLSLLCPLSLRGRGAHSLPRPQPRSLLRARSPQRPSRPARCPRSPASSSTTCFFQQSPTVRLRPDSLLPALLPQLPGPRTHRQQRSSSP